VWVDRIAAGRFEDTNRLFKAPDQFDLRVSTQGNPLYWAEEIAGLLRPHSNRKSRPLSSSAGTGRSTATIAS
jgi:hypothetical protein